MPAAALLLLLGLAPAWAASAPPVLPRHDVAVTYRLSAPGRPDQSYRLQYDASGERARISNPGQENYFLIDLPAGTAELVVPQLKSVVDTPGLSGLSKQITDARHYARFTYLGEREYAGLSCGDWRITSRQGSAIVCLTPDGVPLHFNGRNAHGSASVTATAVSFAPQPGAAFVAPPGYNAITLPPALLDQLIGAAAQ